MTAIYRTFFQFPELHNQFHWSIHATGMLVSVGCAALGSLRGSRAVLRLQPGRGHASQSAPPRRRRLSGTHRLVLAIAQLRLADGAAQRAAHPAADGRLHLRRRHGRQRAGQRLHDADCRSNYLIDFQFRRIMRSDIDLTFKDERGQDALRRGGASCRASIAPSRC